MKTLSEPPTKVTFLGACKNVALGLFERTAKFANYQAASPTATTRVGGRIGTNPNSIYNSMQRVGMAWTSEMLQKNAPLAMAYLGVRGNYCRPTRWKPDTGDSELNRMVAQYCEEKWRTMGVSCSMQAAVARTLHIETPIRGDAGLIIWRDESGDLRLIEFSADQLGEIYNFTLSRICSLARKPNGEIYEVSGNDLTYFSGRYFRGADCVAYKIYERTNSWYGNPRIYDAADVIYTVDPFNFRGVRGITVFHAVMDCIQKGETLLQIGIDAAMRQSKTAFFSTNAQGGPMEPFYPNDPNNDIITDSDGRITYAERIPNGPLIEYGYTGDTMSAVSPDSPGPELIQGVQELDQRFCIGLKMTYAFVVSGEKLGGAISRLDANRSGNEIERLREDLSNPCLDRISKITILDGVRRGELPSQPGIDRGHWSYVNLPTADAFKDSMDDIKSVRAGQDSDSRVLSRYGTTPEEIMRDKEDETFLAYSALDRVQKRLRDAGIKQLPSIADIKQISDNPQQAAAADNLQEGKSATGAPDATAKMAEWDESKHPRGNKDNAGEFGPGGGKEDRSEVRSKRAEVGEMHPAQKSGTGKESKITLSDGSQAPSHIKASMIPPAYRHNLKISKDPNADVWAISEDEHGNSKRVYNPSFASNNQAIKWARVNNGVGAIDKIRSQIHSDRNQGSNKEEADASWLMSQQATRPGSEEDTKGNKSLWSKTVDASNFIVTPQPKGAPKVKMRLGDSTIPIRDDGACQEIASRIETGKPLENAGYWLKSHGATTLEGRHVIPTKDGGAKLQFMGKEGVWHDHAISDPNLAKMLLQRKESAGDSGKLFNTNYNNVAKYVGGLGDGTLSPKDLRTIRANELTAQIIGNKPRDFDSEEERKSYIKSVAEKVSGVLGNRPQQALESYINPMVFDALHVREKKAA